MIRPQPLGGGLQYFQSNRSHEVSQQPSWWPADSEAHSGPAMDSDRLGTRLHDQPTGIGEFLAAATQSPNHCHCSGSKFAPCPDCLILFLRAWCRPSCVRYFRPRTPARYRAESLLKEGLFQEGLFVQMRGSLKTWPFESAGPSTCSMKPCSASSSRRSDRGRRLRTPAHGGRLSAHWQMDTTVSRTSAGTPRRLAGYACCPITVISSSPPRIAVRARQRRVRWITISRDRPGDRQSGGRERRSRCRRGGPHTGNSKRTRHQAVNWRRSSV
jgi:hypothetical protein